jgi:hypothetical protein
MRKKEPPAGEPNQPGPVESVQRMGLLSQRFSETEIKYLCQLQVRCRERPDPLDLPMAERRLQFVRWLARHGYLSEDDGTGHWRPPWDEEGSSEKWPRQRESDSPLDLPTAEPGCAPVPPHGHRLPPKQRSRSWLSVWSWIRRGLTAAVGVGGEVRGWPSLPRGLDPHSLYGNAYSGADAYWYWIYLRHPW